MTSAVSKSRTVYTLLDGGSAPRLDVPKSPVWSQNWVLPGTPNLFVTANTACLVDFQLCQNINNYRQGFVIQHLKHLAVVTFLAHPLLWAKHKLKGLSVILFGMPWRIPIGVEWILYLEGTIIYGLGLAGLFMLVRYRHASYRIMYFGALLLGFFTASVIMFVFVHFEFRYALHLRLVLFFLPFWVTNLLSMRFPPKGNTYPHCRPI